MAFSLLASSMFFFAPQTAEAATYCSNNTFNFDRCYESFSKCVDAGQDGCHQENAVVYCRVNNPNDCYREANPCASGGRDCSMGDGIETARDNAKNKKQLVDVRGNLIAEGENVQQASGEPVGKTYCSNNLLQDDQCYASLEACHANAERNCEEYNGVVYCRLENPSLCYDSLDNCDGVLGNTECASALGIQNARATAAGGGANIDTTIRSSGRFDYAPLESSFISRENAELPKFLQFIFNTGVALAGLAALVMISIGGITYIGSAGNNATAESAKRMIRDSLLGLMLVFFSWIILFVINPDLVGIGENLEKITAVSEYTMRDTAGAGGTTGGGSGRAPGAGGTTGGTGTIPSGTIENPVAITGSDIPMKPVGQGCERVAGVSDNACYVDSGTMAKLEIFNELMKGQNVNGWWITEAWPPTGYAEDKPTGIHSNPCHANGTCVDLSFSKKYGADTGKTSFEEIQAVVSAAKDSGLRPVLEVGNEATKARLAEKGIPASDIKVYDWVKGAVHFSLYDE